MLKRFVRILLEPFTRIFRAFFDPRFFKIEAGVTKVYAKLDAVADAIWIDSQRAVVRDAALRDGMSLMNARVTRIEDSVARIEGVTENLRRVLPPPGDPAEMSAYDESLLNYAESHRGYRSQAGLWFNPPDVVEYRDGEVSLSTMTERSIEAPFVIANVTKHVAPPASVLDVGCTESLVPLELASLGYSVTGIDLREYPLHHPNLTTYAVPLEDWEHDGTFDVVVCLSSIEHFGLGAYGEEHADDRLDHEAMRILRGLVAPDGLLVMTIPYGETEITPVQRMYDRDDLEALLSGWVIDTIQIAEPAEQGWAILDEIPEPAPTEVPPVTRQVALITARPDA